MQLVQERWSYHIASQLADLGRNLDLKSCDYSLLRTAKDREGRRKFIIRLCVWLVTVPPVGREFLRCAA